MRRPLRLSAFGSEGDNPLYYGGPSVDTGGSEAGSSIGTIVVPPPPAPPVVYDFGPPLDPALPADLYAAMRWAKQRAIDILPRDGMDGEGNVTAAPSLSQMGMGHDDPWRAALFGSFGGAGSMGPGSIYAMLDAIAREYGCPALNWEPYAAWAAQRYNGGTYDYRETPYSYPVHMILARAALDCPALATPAANTAPGTKFWSDAQALAWEYGQASSRGNTMALFSVAAIVGGALFSIFGTGAATAASSAVAEESAALGIAETGASAELAALNSVPLDQMEVVEAADALQLVPEENVTADLLEKLYKLGKDQLWKYVLKEIAPGKTAAVPQRVMVNPQTGYLRPYTFSDTLASSVKPLAVGAMLGLLFLQ